MRLGPDLIGFLQPALNCIIQFAGRLDAEMMYVAARRERFDAAEARALQAAVQDDMGE